MERAEEKKSNVRRIHLKSAFVVKASSKKLYANPTLRGNQRGITKRPFSEKLKVQTCTSLKMRK